MENPANKNLSGKETKLPTDIIFWIALSGIGFSAILQVLKKNPQHPLIDLCAAPFVLWMVFPKLKKNRNISLEMNENIRK